MLNTQLNFRRAPPSSCQALSGHLPAELESLQIEPMMLFRQIGANRRFPVFDRNIEPAAQQAEQSNIDRFGGQFAWRTGQQLR